jgi:hypothetical protein
VKALTYRDRDCLSHEPRTIGRFADLKAFLFPNIPPHSITPVINACAARFPNENVATNSCLSVSRLSTQMGKLSTKAGFNETDSVFFALHAAEICRHRWLVRVAALESF